MLLIGGGGHCRSVIDVLETAGLPVDGIVHGTDCEFVPVLGYPALGRDTDLSALRLQYHQALVTVGQIKNSSLRQQLFVLLEDIGFDLPSPISPRAYASAHAVLGKGTIIMHHALVNAGAVIGKNCIINSKALVEHDCLVEDHCHIAVNATLCGGAQIGEGSFIGACAIVRENVSVGKNSIIGMGAEVRRDVAEGERYVD